MKVFITRVWGFDPERWPVITFGLEGNRDNLLQDSSPGDRIVFVGTLREPTPEPLRGRLLGMAEIGRIAVDTLDVIGEDVRGPQDYDEAGHFRWPKAILMVSAHWEEAPLALGAVETIPLVYDFWGFPEHYYRVRYPAPGAPELAESVRKLLRAPGTPVQDIPDRGLDHGAYVPLVEMFPEADIPVLQISMPTLDPVRLMEIGRRLASLSIEQQHLLVVQLATRRYWDWVAAGSRLHLAEALLNIALAREDFLRESVQAGQIAAIELAENARTILQRRSLLLIALGTACAAQLGAAFATGFWMLFASRLLFGMAIAAHAPTSIATSGIISQPGDRGRAVSLVTAGFSLASVMGVPLGVWLGGLAGWRATMLAASGLILATLVWYVVSIPKQLPLTRLGPRIDCFGIQDIAKQRLALPKHRRMRRIGAKVDELLGILGEIEQLRWPSDVMAVFVAIVAQHEAAAR